MSAVETLRPGQSDHVTPWRDLNRGDPFANAFNEGIGAFDEKTECQRRAAHRLRQAHYGRIPVSRDD